MKFKLSTVLLVFLLILPLSSTYSLIATAAPASASPNIFLGVDVSFESVPATEQLIDNVSSYTNLFVIGCYGHYNLTRLSVLSQYVYDKGLSFIVYTDSPRYPSSQWLAGAKNTYGDHFLGIYYFDEAGGKQLDQSSYPAVTNATSFNDAATKYVQLIYHWLRSGSHAITRSFAYPTEFPLFTSDYSLYWYDYAAGYDTVFAEFTMNYSQQLNLDLVRGAAIAENKDWGVIITWKYTQPPYLDTGQNIYSQMETAYNAGAKYILLFDLVFDPYNVTDKPYGTMTDEHFRALQNFWNQVLTKQKPNASHAEAALVLPYNYGWGLRNMNDKIWGFWGPDDKSPLIWNNTQTLLTKYGLRLDIIYDDPAFPIEGNYSKIYYSNQTIS